MRCKNPFCGEEIINKGKGKMYKDLCYECSIGEKVWRRIKKEGDNVNCTLNESEGKDGS